jgi:hypothetical protein
MHCVSWDLILNITPMEHFALMDAYYGIIRILHGFPCLPLPEAYSAKLSGLEKQDFTIVVSTAGCKRD